MLQLIINVTKYSWNKSSTNPTIIINLLYQNKTKENQQKKTSTPNCKDTRGQYLKSNCGEAILLLTGDMVVVVPDAIMSFLGTLWAENSWLDGFFVVIRWLVPLP